MNLDEIIKQVQNNDLIIVEGKKDRMALNELGLKNILYISGKPIYDVVDEALSGNPDSVSILTDYDSEGELIAKNLSEKIREESCKGQFFI